MGTRIEKIKDRLHFGEFNVPEALRWAKKCKSDIDQDRVVLALDTRDPLARKIAQAASPTMDFDKHNARLERAGMIPTIWTIVPREMMHKLLLEVGMESGHALAVQAGATDFWFIALTDNGAVIQLMPRP